MADVNETEKKFREETEQRLRESIAAVLKETGEQQKDLAALIGISPTLVSRRQRGTKSWEIWEVAHLARHWQMPVGALFEGADAARQALPEKHAAWLRRSGHQMVTQAA